jgi:hypothetical protein
MAHLPWGLGLLGCRWTVLIRHDTGNLGLLVVMPMLLTSVGGGFLGFCLLTSVGGGFLGFCLQRHHLGTCRPHAVSQDINI